METVDFFFGPGSRYSYLAATQLKSITERTGARFRWRALFSGDLIEHTSQANPFSAGLVRGQYTPEYRTRDVARWAAHYRVPYTEPCFEDTDWRAVALWCAGAELLGEGYGAWILNSVFAKGLPPQDLNDLRAGAEAAGIDPIALTQIVENGKAAERYAANLNSAIEANAFGVPTFIAADGELFWGQDRLPLLCDHLTSSRSEQR
jgi:2-hydroxychromene-2-carboxylate isomerase